MTPTLSFSAHEQLAQSRGIDTRHLRELVANEKVETPVLFLSRSEVGKNYRALKQALRRVHIHYAVKPNIHEVVLKEVAAQGGNFDVCSAGEIKEVTRLGADARTLVHSHPIKSIPEWDFAVNSGVEVFVVDNPEEIKKLARYRDKQLKLMIRFRVDIENTAVVNLQYKYGCRVEEVLPLARLIREQGQELHGLCFHIGSQCIYPQNYVKAITTAKELIHQLDLEGFGIKLLDIGGGFPVEYTEQVPSIEEFCVPIAEALDTNIRPGIKVISEPGRFIAATPVTLVATVIGKSERDGKLWYYLDDGLYSTFSGMLYDHCSYPIVTTREADRTRLSTVSGPTCDSFDVMYDNILLPEHNIGDKMIFPCTGAYCSVSGSNFNALKRPEYVVID